MTLSQIHTWRRKESCGRSTHSGARRGLRGWGGGGPWQGLRVALTCTPAERLVGIEDSGEKSKGKSTHTE